MLDEEKITLRGASHEIPGCVPGDAVFVLSEQPHDTFQKRRGAHLYMTKNIPLANALTGFEFIIKHLDGRKLVVSTQQGQIISPGMQLELPHEGMPERKFSSERGSLFITFTIEFPLSLTPAQTTSILAGLPDLLPKVTVDDGEEVERVELQEAVDGGDEDDDEEESGSGEEGGHACMQQ